MWTTDIRYREEGPLQVPGSDPELSRQQDQAREEERAEEDSEEKAPQADFFQTPDAPFAPPPPPHHPSYNPAAFYKMYFVQCSLHLLSLSLYFL